MSRKPKYSRHGHGYARVKINGEIYSLGKHDSDESWQKYHRLIAEHWNGTDEPRRDLPSYRFDEITITELAIRYTKHTNDRVGESENFAVRAALKLLRRFCGTMLAAEFDGLKYQNFVDWLIDEKDLARSTLNHYTHHVKAMFKHASKFRIVPTDWHHRLNIVGIEEEGYTRARETDDILPPDDDIVDATVVELPQHLKDMIQLQRLCGCRPGELVTLRPCDIDRSDPEVWLFRPPLHKNSKKKSHKARIRIIGFGGRAQEILTPYLLRDHQAFCFVPPTPNKNPRYDTGSYRKAVQRAIKRAFPLPEKPTRTQMEQWKEKYLWSPNQLRHEAASNGRKLGGIELAQQLMGHTTVRTTEKVYAEIDTDKMIEYARKYG